MQPKHPIFQKCIAQLEALPNLKAMVKVEPFVTADVLADGQLTLRGPNDTTDYVCEIKLELNNDVVEQVIQYVKTLQSRLQEHQRPLLVTQHLSNLMIDQLLDQNIEFIDIDGRLYLNSPAAYVLVRPANAKQSVELTTTSLQVIYALLSNPEHVSCINPDYFTQPSNVTSVAGVSPETLKTTLETLQTLDYIRVQNGRYKINNYLKLLERWELGYLENLRTKLFIGTFRPVDTNNFTAKIADIKFLAREYHYWIGGELGAAMKTQYLRPIGTTLHFQEDNYRMVAVALKLKPDPKGNITILRTFGERNPEQFIDNQFAKKHLAHPLLIHAELVSSYDSRLKEMAQILYNDYIKALSQNS